MKDKSILGVVSLLDNFWEQWDFIKILPFDSEVGAATLHPTGSFFPILKQVPFKYCYFQLCRRPGDNRAIWAQNRLQRFLQYQVLALPPITHMGELFIKSLYFIGFSVGRYDFKFLKDDWHSPVIGASGIGWEVRLNGQEIAQITYFHTCGGKKLAVPVLEITYGIERICSLLQDKCSMFEMTYCKDDLYKDHILQYEQDHSKTLLEATDSDKQLLQGLIKDYRSYAISLCHYGALIPAYEYVLKMSHILNLLDASNVLSHVTRGQHVMDIRNIAVNIAEKYTKDQIVVADKVITTNYIESENIVELRCKDIKPKCEHSVFFIEIGMEPLSGTLVSSINNNLEIRNVFLMLLKSLGCEIHNPCVYCSFRRLFFIARLSDIETMPIMIDQEINKFITNVFYTISINQENICGNYNHNSPVPIIWYNAYCDGKPFNISKFHGVISNNGTQSRIHNLDWILWHDTSNPIHTLLDHDIIISQVDRLSQAVEIISKLSKQHDVFHIMPEKHLLNLVNVTEYPHVIICTFDSKYLSLPASIITYIIEQHICGIPLFSIHSKELENAIFYICDICQDTYISETSAAISTELTNRLQDAWFFLKQDSNTPIPTLLSMAHIKQYAEGLGSYGDKEKRLKYLASKLSGCLTSEEQSWLTQSILYCFIDHGTKTLHEYPYSNGCIAKYILQHNNIMPPEVLAIISQYKFPRHHQDEVPSSICGGVLSIIDKLDSLIMMWSSTNIKLSSKKDPYGLKRLGYGVVKCCIKWKLPFALKDIISSFIADGVSYEDYPAINKDNIDIHKLYRFLKIRTKQVLLEYWSDQEVLIVACINANTSINVYNIYKTVNMVVSNAPENLALIKAVFKRAYNIVNHDIEDQRPRQFPLLSIGELYNEAVAIQNYLDKEKILVRDIIEQKQKKAPLIMFVYRALSLLDIKGLLSYNLAVL